MNRKTFLFLLAGSLSCTSVFAASNTYKYRCPKCKLIQEYGTPGTKKCPNDGRIMIRQSK
jgi:hypothetical protein